MVEDPGRPEILWPTSAAPLTMGAPPVEGRRQSKMFGPQRTRTPTSMACLQLL